MRGASPRTPAIAHTYLYTVIFKMKERRAGGRIVVVFVVKRTLLTGDGRDGKKDRTGDKRSITFPPGWFDNGRYSVSMKKPRKHQVARLWRLGRAREFHLLVTEQIFVES